MGNLLTSLLNTANSLRAVERALTVTENNVVNASTPGFAKQTATFEAMPFDLTVGLPGGVISGPGCMDYVHDMVPYIQEMADWLDNPKRVHPCNGETTYKGFEIMMAICRSATQGGKVKLPLGRGEPELPALQKALSRSEAAISTVA